MLIQLMSCIKMQDLHIVYPCNMLLDCQASATPPMQILEMASAPPYTVVTAYT